MAWIRFFATLAIAIGVVTPHGERSVRADGSVLFSLSAFQAAEIVEVAAVQQAVNIKKALEYDNAQQGRKGPINIGLIFAPGNRQSVEMKDAMISAFGTATTVLRRQVVPKPIPLTSAVELAHTASAQQLAAMMLMPGTGQVASDVVNIGKAQKILTIASVPAYTKYGVALSFGLYQDKVTAIVDKPAAKQQGTKFDSEYLRRSSVRR